MDFKSLLKAYLASDAYLSVSQSTKRAYAHLINRLAQVNEIPMQIGVAYAEERSHMDHWGAFVRSLPISNAEKNRTIMMVQNVYGALGIGHLVARLKKYDHTKSEAHPLTSELVEHIWKTRFTKRCFVVLLRFHFYTGMRPSEVRNLKWANVSAKFITVIGSKGREKGKPSRMIVITEPIKECLAYFREHSVCEYVAVGVYGKKLCANTVCVEMKAIREAVGFEGVLYDARRGIATEMKRSGVDVYKVRDFLGHRDVATTEVYFHETMEEKALAVALPTKDGN